MNIIIRYTKYIFICLTIVLSANKGKSNSLIPSIGEMIQIERVNRTPIWMDSLCLCPDLSDVELTDRTIINVIEPLSEDVRSDMLISYTSEVYSIKITDNGTVILSMSSPSLTKVYIKPIHLNFKSDCSGLFQAKGKFNGIASFYDSGEFRSSIIHNLMLVTPQMDTIKRVRLYELNLKDTLYITKESPNLHEGLLRLWFTDSCSYPILVQKTDRLLSLNMDTLDVHSEWSYSSGSVVEMNTPSLFDDTYHQAMQYKSANNVLEIESPSDEKGQILTYNDDTIIIRNIQNSPWVKVIICDLGGRIFLYKDKVFNNTTDNDLKIPIKGIYSGNFLVYFYTKEEKKLFYIRIR